MNEMWISQNMPKTQSQLKSWQKTKLGDFIIFNYGKGLPERDRVSGPYPVFGSAGVVDTNKISESS